MSFRRRLLHVHRWAGIGLAAFLVLSGVTGSLLAFHHEIDAAIAPELHQVVPGPARASLDAIAARIEARHPQLTVGYFVLSVDADRAMRAVMNTREAADAGLLDREAAQMSEVYVDPYSGRLLGERKWGDIGATRAHLVPMIYRLHMSLFLGTAGQWITAIVALLWIGAMALGVVLAVPRLRLWRTALAVKWHASGARVLFDVHRTAGIGAFVVLVVIAFTGFYMNLPSVIEPALAAVAPFTPRPASVRTPQMARSEVWRVGWDEALASARQLEPVHPLAVIGRVEGRGYYQVRFVPPDDIMDAGTIRIFVGGRDGAVLGRFEDRAGTVGDQIRIWQFPLHSGQGFGLAGRILVCVAGALPLLLAATGIGLWLRRRRLRRQGAPGPGIDPIRGTSNPLRAQ
jgi:uncharacterized iron-regulated membrane protein